jgi:hypothetical protein
LNGCSADQSTGRIASGAGIPAVVTVMATMAAGFEVSVKRQRSGGLKT